MIRANCSNKLTSVCTGHCDTCVNGMSIYGHSAIDNAEIFKENYNKGYIAGVSDAVNYTIDYIMQLRYGQTEVAIVEALKIRFPYVRRYRK